MVSLSGAGTLCFWSPQDKPAALGETGHWLLVMVLLAPGADDRVTTITRLGIKASQLSFIFVLYFSRYRPSTHSIIHVHQPWEVRGMGIISSGQRRKHGTRYDDLPRASHWVPNAGLRAHEQGKEGLPLVHHLWLQCATMLRHPHTHPLYTGAIMNRTGKGWHIGWDWARGVQGSGM